MTGTLRDSVIFAAREIARETTLEDDDLQELLVRSGMEDLLARLCVALVPTAFGRKAVLELGTPKFPDRMIAKSRTGKWITYRLSSQPVYAIAVELANGAGPNGELSAREAGCIAARSAEMNAVRKAQAAGSDVTGGVFSPVGLIGVKAEELGTDGRVSWWRQLLGA